MAFTFPVNVHELIGERESQWIDGADRLQQGAQQLGQWVLEGKLHVEEHVVDGFEQAPHLLPTMFSGKEPGKLILKVADPE